MVVMGWTTTRERRGIDTFVDVVEVTTYRVEEEDFDVPPGFLEEICSDTVWYADFWPLWLYGGED